MAHDSPSVDDIGFFLFVHILCFELLVPEFFCLHTVVCPILAATLREDGDKTRSVL